MRSLLCLCVLGWLTAPSLAAVKPDVDGPEGQRAFDDLAGLYATGTPIAAEEQAFKNLASLEPATRAAAGRYLAALLKQSWADEDNGRAQWRKLPFFGGGSESPSREYRKLLAGKIADGPAAAELLDAELWLLNSDLLAEDAQAGAKALTRNPSPTLVDTYRTLLARGHPNSAVLATLIADAGKRKYVALSPEIKALCNEPRKVPREAARTAAQQLGMANIAPFAPEQALTGYVDGELKNILAMVLPAVPPSATWKRFTVKTKNPRNNETNEWSFSGWLISEDPKAWHVVDLFGQEQALDRATTTSAERALTDDAREFQAVRSGGASDSNLERSATLSSGGLATAQFEARFVSLPEALLAAWALQRGDRKTAAAVILPCFDAAADERWIGEVVRDLLAQKYQQQMLDALTSERDYPQVLRIANHLGKLPFKGWRYFERTKELAQQFARRGDDFKTFVLPTPDQWKAMRAKLDRPAQVAYLAKRIRLLNAFQWGQPGGVDFGAPQSREPRSDQRNKPNASGVETINPLIELRNMHLEVRDLPTLIPFLDDDNFVLAYGYWRDFHPDRDLYRVNGFVVRFVNDAARRELIDWSAYEQADPAGKQKLKQDAGRWIAANAARSLQDLLLENLAKSHDPNEVLAAARELTLKKVAAALPIMFERIANLPDPKDRAMLVECCFRLAPDKCLDQARHWVTQGGDVSFWAALILFTAGDRAKNEGLAELQRALAADGSNLWMHKRACDTLIKSGRPAALDLAAGVFKHVTPETSDWDIRPFVQRLFLAGRQEALDYLLAALDDKASGGTMFTEVDGKQVRVELTKGDNAAELVSQLRSDKYEYSKTAPEKARTAERARLKEWLQRQMKLIRAGKPAGIRTDVPDFAFPTWTLDAP